MSPLGLFMLVGMSLLGLTLLFLLARSRAFRQGLLPATTLPPSPLRESDAIIAFGLLLIAIGSVQAAVLLLDLYLGGNTWREEPFLRLLLGISPTGLAALSVLGLAAFRSASPTRALGLGSTERARDMARGVVVYLAAYPGVMGTIVLWGGLLAWLGVKFRPQDVWEIVLAPQPWLEVAVSVATAILVVPFFEEMIFRGFLLRALSQRLGGTGAVLFTATVFALLHRNAYASGPAFVLGLLLGWLYWRTGRLWLAVGCHGANNAAALVMKWLSQS